MQGHHTYVEAKRVLVCRVVATHTILSYSMQFRAEKYIAFFFVVTFELFHFLGTSGPPRGRAISPRYSKCPLDTELVWVRPMRWGAGGGTGRYCQARVRCSMIQPLPPKLHPARSIMNACCRVYIHKSRFCVNLALGSHARAFQCKQLSHSNCRRD